MIPDFKIKTRPATEMGYQQVVHVDAHGRTILEFVPDEAMKKVVKPVDRFVGIDNAEAEVMAQNQPATAQTQLRFPIPAKSLREAWDIFDASAQKCLDQQMSRMRQQALISPQSLPSLGNGF